MKAFVVFALHTIGVLATVPVGAPFNHLPHDLAGHASANPWILVVVVLALVLWAAVAGAVRLLRAVGREALWILILRRLLGR